MHLADQTAVSGPLLGPPACGARTAVVLIVETFPKTERFHKPCHAYHDLLLWLSMKPTPFLGLSHYRDGHGSRSCQKLDCIKSIDRVQSFHSQAHGVPIRSAHDLGFRLENNTSPSSGELDAVIGAGTRWSALKVEQPVKSMYARHIVLRELLRH